MTDTSLILGLPYIQASQAQKHVTHNEALRVLDALVQLSVIARDLGLPPAGVEAGDRYLVAAPAQGAWAGQTNAIAIYEGTTWSFLAPQVGWQAYVQEDATTVVFDGTGWVGLDATTADSFGINASADSFNRLTVSSDAVLLNHAGSGHQVKVNKATQADTASLLFQSGFSGRAEMGIAGNDDFSIKVSADGNTFTEALRIDGATGMVDMPQSRWRRMLDAPRTYYVDQVQGNDSNDGLSAGTGAFASIAKAIAEARTIDAGGYDVIVQLADGTYQFPTALMIDAVVIGAPQLVIQGNVANPAQVVLNGTHEALKITAGTVLLRGMRLQNASPSREVVTVQDRAMLIVESVDFGPAGGHINAIGAHFRVAGSYSISGGARYHLRLVEGASARGLAGTVTLTGTPDFAVAGIICLQCSTTDYGALTFAGAATGQRYLVSRNAVIETGGKGEMFLPGSVNGVASLSGYYL